MTGLLLADADAPVAAVFVELGLAISGLALLTRLAYRVGISSIPLYLIGGLAFGVGGVFPLSFSTDFLSTGAEIGVILLLFLLGLEYSSEDLSRNLRTGLPAGVTDLLLNFPSGFIVGLVLGFPLLAAVILGGATYISSSGIAAKLLGDIGRKSWLESKTVVAVLVLEDLAMAVFLPVVAVLLIGQGPREAAVSVVGALVVVTVVLVVAVRFGPRLTEFADHRSDEVVLLTSVGMVFAVAGFAEGMQVSAAVGSFLAGVALSGPLAERTRRLLMPLRDLFSALFFLFFGLQTNPRQLPAVVLAALVLALVGAGTKLLTGWWAVRRAGGDSAAGWRAGALLIARGEFSVVLAGLGAVLEPRLAPLVAAYVLILAISGPVLVRVLAWREEKSRPTSE